MRRIAALCVAASALLVSRVCLILAPGWIVKIAVAPVDNPRPVNSVRIRDLCGAVTAIGARPPFSATCLEQGIALVMLLTIARIPANLVVGVARAESTFRAHAWVECGGAVVLGGAQLHRFTPLLRVPASSRPSPFSASCPG